jgi:Domain of unknown function (DUF4288)
MTSKSKQKRYAAKLLFQFRVVVNNRSGKRRFCEERIIVLMASHTKSALALAKQRGIQCEYSYDNDEGNHVYFEFIGLLDLIELGIECSDDEVWYEIKEKILPSERRDKLLPPETKLNAIWHENNATKKKRRH